MRRNAAGALENASDAIVETPSVVVTSGGFSSAKMGLHGPYETLGIPFAAVPTRVRTARTRHRTTPVTAGSWWNVQNSRSSATFVFVATTLSGPRNQTL